MPGGVCEYHGDAKQDEESSRGMLRQDRADPEKGVCLSVNSTGFCKKDSFGDDESLASPLNPCNNFFPSGAIIVDNGKDSDRVARNAME